MPRADRTRHTRPRPRVSVPSRPSRYLDRTSPRQSCGRDHAGALRVITRAEVAEEYNGLTHNCDDHGYGYGDSRTVLLNVVQGSAFGGFRRSRRVHNDDKRRAILILLGDEEWSTWSNRAIAPVSVSPDMVNRLRTSLKQAVSREPTPPSTARWRSWAPPPVRSSAPPRSGPSALTGGEAPGPPRQQSA